MNLRVGLRHRAKEGPHLLRRQAGPAGLQGELDAVGDALGGASSDISGSVSAFAMVSGSVGG